MSMPPSKPLPSLPQDVLMYILEKLPTSKVFELSEVDRAFHRAALARHKACYGQLAHILPLKTIENIIARMHFDPYEMSEMALIQKIFRENMERISKYHTSGLGPDIVELVQDRIPSLSIPLHQELQRIQEDDVSFDEGFLGIDCENRSESYNFYYKIFITSNPFIKRKQPSIA